MQSRFSYEVREVKCRGKKITVKVRDTDGMEFKASASCSPYDKFNFFVGAQIATRRAIEKMISYKMAEENYIDSCTNFDRSEWGF